MCHTAVERVNVDNPITTQLLACDKNSIFPLFFLFFLLSVALSCLPLFLGKFPWPSALWLSRFSSGSRTTYGSFQDTDILSCLFSSLQSCFPIQVTFPAGKLGPHKSCWQPQTDPVENHPILGRRLKRTTLCVHVWRQFTSLGGWPDYQSHSPHNSVSAEMERPFPNLIVTCFHGCGMQRHWCGQSWALLMSSVRGTVWAPGL